MYNRTSDAEQQSLGCNKVSKVFDSSHIATGFPHVKTRMYVDAGLRIPAHMQWPYIINLVPSRLSPSKTLQRCDQS